MLQSTPRRQAEEAGVGALDGTRQRRRLFLAVILLVAAIAVVGIKNWDYWFGSDGESVAEDTPAESAPTTVEATAPVAPPHKHPAIKSTSRKAGIAASHSGIQNVAERVRISAEPPREPYQSINAPYPLLAGQMAIQGSVLLEALIGADGMVEEMRVLSGPTILVSAAREAVRQWRFKPYLVDGQPVETQARVTVNFKIKVSDNVAKYQVDSISTGGAL